MVGCGRCDDWFHGDCVGLDLTKVREMEEEDQMYVCLKCCEEESKKVEPEPPKPEVQAKPEVQDQKPPPKPRPGPSQTLTSGGVRPVRKVSATSVSAHNKTYSSESSECESFIHKDYLVMCFLQLIHPLILIIASVTSIQGFVVLLLLFLYNHVGVWLTGCAHQS